MKPILFNTEMVHAILEGRKTVTRRVVKGYALDHLEFDTDGSIIGVYDQDEGRVFPIMDYAPYHPGDILYVRETWAAWSRTTGVPPTLYYKADGNAPDSIKWRPSIHMPREAARIFLRVTGVRVERLQYITEEQARAEGVEPFMMTTDVDKPDGQKRWKEMLSVLQMFPGIWDSTIKPTDRSLYGWESNPWVWVIEFERCEKPEGD